MPTSHPFHSLAPPQYTPVVVALDQALTPNLDGMGVAVAADTLELLACESCSRMAASECVLVVCRRMSMGVKKLMIESRKSSYIHLLKM